MRALTGIRGAAALLVLLYHLYSRGRVFGPLQPVVDHGYLAVDLFFVLSGFILALTYGERFRAGVLRRDLRDFFWRRLGRLYPLYVAASMLALGLDLLLADSFKVPSTAAFLANVAMIQAWGIGASVCGQAWSISTERGAYFTFPFLVLLLSRRPWSVVPCLLLSVSVLLILASSDARALGETPDARSGSLDIWNGATAFPLLRCLAGFALGVAACRVGHLSALNRAFQVPCLADIAACLALGAMWAGRDVAAVASFAILIAALARGSSLSGRFLATAPVHWLGVISYSIYLLQITVWRGLRLPVEHLMASAGVPHAPSVTRAVIVVVVIIVADISYRLIERPARNAVRRLDPMRDVPRNRKRGDRT